MSEIFISYARRSTEAQAGRIAEALRALGYGVWRDDEILPDRSFTEEIERRLEAAKAVVVVWSADASKSDWVRSEAEHAREKRKLVQLTIDGARLPMPFDQIQCADLSGWSGDPRAREWMNVVASVTELTGRSCEAPAAPAPARPHGKPTLAVAPFANLSSDPDQAYFADGMVEDIVASLARFKSIHVISAGSGVVSRGRVLSPQDAARQCGVSYLLEGSVRKAADQVRITVHLVDGGSGVELWADRMDGAVMDIFALQDRVAERVAGAIEPIIQDAGLEEATRRPTTDLDSYDLYLRSLPPFRASRRAEMLHAIELLEQAIALDPNFALAISQSVVCHRQVIDHDWTDEPDLFRRRGLTYAERALAAAPDDPKVLAQVAAGLPGLENSLDRALALAARAIALNPGSSFVRLISGSIELRNGEPEAAAGHLEEALRLDPISSLSGFARMYLASARFQQQRFDEAIKLFRTTTLRLPVSYAVLAALHGHLGQLAQAREALEALEGLSAGGVEKFARIWFPRPEYRKLLLDGIALAKSADAPPSS